MQLAAKEHFGAPMLACSTSRYQGDAVCAAAGLGGPRPRWLG
jgi:hypothetical protein